ncbi:GAF domain-containing protein [Marinibactrum halimedae]|uniref:GAF domain-containing protein n=1 Tax=Marinibactrum halimedae TaxID=1444977 RepID=A0AA37T2B3_9GAMM|nr:GAF domain-containing protein [Marinibactrum halimedae]MCD9457807.1 GAF domain-containing protein [Marinibactrum halimedae]GLS24819.1 hypothetical protein GCM10007877_05330 [Marinibactrum halimedae]
MSIAPTTAPSDAEARIYTDNNQPETDYTLLSKQLAALIESEKDTIANMANCSALLYENLEDINWVGFYRLVDNQLVLGPFQGKVACVRIEIGKGVCGTAVAEGVSQRVSNVHDFPGHIACDAASNSEVVIPLRNSNSEVIGVLDIDSPSINRFSEKDLLALEEMMALFSANHC